MNSIKIDNDIIINTCSNFDNEQKKISLNTNINFIQFHYFDQSPFIHSFSGYLYASNNKFENINFIQCYGKIEKYKIKDNWYWVSCLDYREY